MKMTKDKRDQFLFSTADQVNHENSLGIYISKKEK